MTKNRVDIRGLERKLKRIKEEVQKVVKSDKNLKDASSVIVKKIQGDTRTGKFTETGKSLKKVKSSTMRDKKYWEKRGNKKGTSYGTRKSNLTRSGQLISSIKSEVKEGKIRIGARGERTPYKGVKNAPSNKQLADCLKKDGFVFLGVGEKTKQAVAELFRKRILNAIRKIKNKKII